MLDVSVKKLSFSYDSELILGDINIEVKAGAFVCLLGQSGCGKSTFLRCYTSCSFSCNTLRLRYCT
ncbi:ATP-binding cassette domain-containing protein [Clostridium magnum]|uniref:Putative HMP/thiamine import ATP-binding protein YkoD n=1 Tax=Clostridium magnum DSM 2767 TaxID=1121326 RepID=A0A161WW44_9CLOT|nr:ABC transporter ATP-binding protein [Clostridium magnum]KZL91188.1 putative HMP/thiamine import ATP-binding protein YkoD [Clostridium magnum DSM 2767]SHI17480.1 ABC transporter [Clostridium magnum DSM 2767]